MKKTICCCVNIEMSMPLPYLLPNFNGCVTQSWNKHIFGNSWAMRLLSTFPHVQKHSYLIYRAPEPPLQVSLTNVKYKLLYVSNWAKAWARVRAMAKV